MLEWRLYYAGGATFDNLQGIWELAPQTGVIAAVTADLTRGCLIYHKVDFYFKVGNQFGCTDLVSDLVRRFGLDPDGWNTKDEFLALMRKHPEVKFGEWVSNDEYRAVLSQATDDANFPKLHPRRRMTDDHLRHVRG